MNQATWDAMLLDMARRCAECHTAHHGTADLMARISRALGIDPMEKENAPAPAATEGERK